MIVGTVTTFVSIVGLAVCLGCAVVVQCLRQETSVVVVPNPVRVATAVADEDPGPVSIAVATVPSQIQPEPGPPGD